MTPKPHPFPNVSPREFNSFALCPESRQTWKSTCWFCEDSMQDSELKMPRYPHPPTSYLRQLTVGEELQLPYCKKQTNKNPCSPTSVGRGFLSLQGLANKPSFHELTLAGGKNIETQSAKATTKITINQPRLNLQQYQSLRSQAKQTDHTGPGG